MSGSPVNQLGLPKLPPLDAAAVRAVRSSPYGKLLGRTAALLSLVLSILAYAGGVDWFLRNVFGIEVRPTSLFFILFIGLPVLIVVCHLVIEWRASRELRRTKELAVKVDAVPSGYFRIGPYLDTAEDRAKFHRADKAQEKVPGWIVKTSSVPLYLTGDSGSGKSSLLNASVLPSLREQKYIIVEARAGENAISAMLDVLRKLPAVRRRQRDDLLELPDLIKVAARWAEGRLLLILDQFEEFLILARPEERATFSQFVAGLRQNPIKDLRLLLVLRSDYQTILEDIGLPGLRQGENWYPLSRFTLAASKEFMSRSKLSLQPTSLDRILESAAELDETPGMIRPITLNVIGRVLAGGLGVAPSLDADRLIRRYIEQSVEQPGIRDFARPVLGKLVTQRGTKRPRSEDELATETHLHNGEVRAVLNGLSVAALVRTLDAAHGIWELSHDFVARAVMYYLGRRRRDWWRRAANYAAPALLALILVATTGALIWNLSETDRIRSQIDDLGLSSRLKGGWLTIAPNGAFTSLTLTKASLLLRQLGGMVRTMDLHGTQIASVAPLKYLAAIESLDLSHTEVADITPLARLATLKDLNLSFTKIANIDPLKSLSVLQRVDLDNDTRVRDVAPIEGLTALRDLNLQQTSISDISPLKELIALRTLNLTGTQISDLEPLKRLTALRSLDLNSAQQIVNLTPLKGLAALEVLNLTATNVADLTPLRDLIALRTLDLDGTRVDDITPLGDLRALRALELGGTRITQVQALHGLTALQILELIGTGVEDISPLADLRALRTLNLGGTRVVDIGPLRGLTALQDLNLDGTKVADISPLAGLSELRTLSLSGTKITDVAPLERLAALQTLDLSATPVADITPLRRLPALRVLNLTSTRVVDVSPVGRRGLELYWRPPPRPQESK